MKKLHVLCKSRMVFRDLFSKSDLVDKETLCLRSYAQVFIGFENMNALKKVPISELRRLWLLANAIAKELSQNSQACCQYDGSKTLQTRNRGAQARKNESNSGVQPMHNSRQRMNFLQIQKCNGDRLCPIIHRQCKAIWT